MKFEELNVSEKIKKAVLEMGFEGMTEIQEQAIPSAVSGSDVLGQAQTGTGKTAAFCIPVIENLDMTMTSVQCLMLAPTRELAIQITNEINKIGKYMNVKAITVYGGDPIDKQLQLLKRNPQIVVGTPGRCLDMIKRKKLKLSEIKFFVLDEVDEMLNMGFIDDVEFIAEKMPKSKQTLLFSATMPDRIRKICNTFMVDPIHIKVDAKSLTVDKVTQHYIVVKNMQKKMVLENLLLLRQDQKIIIFGQTKRSCDEIYDFLKERKYRAGKIHGDIVQKQRTDTIVQFRNNKFDILVASDVVARGIDIDGIDLVINYELPQDMEYYIHRIGRTGRGNATKGEAITLVSPAVYNSEFRHYPKRLKCDITEMQKPTLKDVQSKLKDKYQEELKSAVALDLPIKDVYKDMASGMVKSSDSTKVIEFLLAKLYPELSKEQEAFDESPERNRGGSGRNKRGNDSSRGRG
ncbi:MAG: DEAD/DEAH box helicase, partial [Mycoplasmatales bacterium]